ncbi:MAG TPA: hypothetical protein VOA41_11470 [Candidatus Dormibacteraeota bacterium]|nr:hypothetical protein [Candidatus Dormibacteraeota bacterium]
MAHSIILGEVTKNLTVLSDEVQGCGFRIANERGRREAACSNSALRPVKECPHGWGGGGVSGALGYAKALEHKAEDALMLVEGDGLYARLAKGLTTTAATWPPPEVKSKLLASSKTKVALLKLRAVKARESARW